MAELRMLPVQYGDACLLRSRRGSYLFDGGLTGGGVPGLLEERKVRRLRTVVCSSPCPERWGGVVDVLVSPLPVTECWLPARVGVLLDAANMPGDWLGWGALPHVRIGTSRDFGGVRQPLTSAAMLLGLATATILPQSSVHTLDPGVFNGVSTDTEGTVHETFFFRLLTLLAQTVSSHWLASAPELPLLADTFMQGGTARDLAVLCGRLLLAEASRTNRLPLAARKRVINCALAGMTGALMDGASTRFRFFDSCGALTDFLIPRHPMKCLNGRELYAGETSVSRATTVGALADSLDDRSGGLVFQYGNSGCSVLFCGDTRMGFLGRGERLLLDRPTVITAPRQGTVSSEASYGAVRAESDDVLWVRGNGLAHRKISGRYRAQERKICLVNCRNRTLQEILLVFRRNRWVQLSGGVCPCA